MAGYVLGNTLSRSGAVTRGSARVGANGELESICETRGVTIRDGAPVDGELRPIDPSSTASMNIWGMPPAFIGYLQENFAPFLRGLAEGDLKSEYLLPNVVGEMVRRGEGARARVAHIGQVVRHDLRAGQARYPAGDRKADPRGRVPGAALGRSRKQFGACGP